MSFITRSFARFVASGFVGWCFVTAAAAAHAQIVTFVGTDAGANATDPRPNATAAAAQFDAAVSALGGAGLLTFENAPLGAFASLAAAPGVTITGSDLNASPQTIRNTPLGSPDSLYGYNTTPGGRQFLSVYGGTVTFTFGDSIQAFGGYFGGVQIAGETVTFTDGTMQSLTLPNSGSGISFVGFTDVGKSIASLQISTLNDIIGIDDVRFVRTSAVPPPPSAVPEASAMVTGLSMAGVTGLGLVRGRRRR